MPDPDKIPCHIFFYVNLQLKKLVVEIISKTTDTMDIFKLQKYDLLHKKVHN